MAGGGHSIFMEDASDDDSISVTSTVASVERDEYAVETVLSKKLDEEGIAYYLIKWEGYPLHASTWEPLENIESDEVLETWQAKQDLVRKGQESPFDLNAFYEAEQEARAKAEDKAARRQAKRERLGTAVPAPGSRSASAPRTTNNDAATGEEEPLARKRRKVSPPKRKDVARTVKKSLNKKPTMAAEASSSSDEDSDVEVSQDRSASEDSLMENLQAQAKRKAPQAKGTFTAKPPSKQMARTSLSDALERKKRDSGVEAPSNKVTTSKVPAKAGLATKKPAMPKAASTTTVPTSGAARKSAPSTVASTKAVSSVAQASGTATRPPLKPATSGAKRASTGNVDIFGNWDRAPEKRKRKSIGEDVSLDTQGKRMAKNLQHQNRIIKKGTRDNAAPDISGLAIFDPASGRMVQPSRPSMTTTDAASPTTAADASSAAFSAAPSAASPAAPTPPLALTAPMMSSTSIEIPIEDRRTASPEKASASTSAPLQAQKSVPVPAAQMTQLEPRLEGPAQPEGAIHRAFGRRGTPPAERPRSVSPAREPQERYGPPSHFNHAQQNEKLMTCRKWANGYCNYSDQDCWFTHYYIDEEEVKRVGRVKAAATAYLRHTQQLNGVQDRHLVPPPPPQFLAGVTGKIARKDITCYFWRRDGHCKKGAYCYFAHQNTGIYTEGPSTKRIWSSGMNDNPTAQQTQRTASGVSPLEPTMRAGNLGDEGEPMILDTAEDPSMGPVAPPMAAPRNDNPPPPPPPPLAHRQTALSTFKHDVTMSIATACEKSANTEIAVALHCDSQQHLYLLKEAMKSNTVLELQSLVGATDLQTYGAELLQQNPSCLVGGDIASADFNDSLLATFAETCRLQVACGAILSPDFTLLVFPSNAGEWDFLDRPNDVPGVPSALRFKLLPQGGASKNLQQPSANLPAPEISSSLASDVAAGRHLLNLDANALLTAFGSKTNKNRIEKVLVVMPPSHQAEMEVFRRFFEASGCEVDTSMQIETCQKYWKDHGQSLTVLHNSTPLNRIPRLGEFLNSPPHEGLQMLSVGSVPAVASGSSGKYTSRLKCQRLFPAAEITLITDDVFVHHPDKATLIIEQLAKANDRSKLPLKSKLATRPGLKDWLMQLAIDSTQSGDRRDERWMKLWAAVDNHLKPYGRDDIFSIGQPGDQSNLISGPADELPIFQDLLQRDEGQAADYLANWFAGFCLAHKHTFRRFSICNETWSSGEQILDKEFRTIIKPGETDPRAWAKEYQHLVVCLPSQWLRKLKERKF